MCVASAMPAASGFGFCRHNHRFGYRINRHRIIYGISSAGLNLKREANASAALLGE